MGNVSKGSGAVSKTVFVSSVVILLAVCVAAGFVGYSLKSSSNYDQLQTNYQSLQSSYNQLQSSYQNLTSEYNQLNSQYQQLLTASGSPTPITTPTAQERITIQGISYDSSHKTVIIYAQSSGGVSPVVSSIIVKDLSGNTVALWV